MRRSSIRSRHDGQRIVAWLAASVLMCVMLPGIVQAQTPNDAAQTPLATKQQIIQDRVLRLEDQMFRLIDKLKDQEPEQARRLVKTLTRLGESGIRQDLKEIVQILNDDQLGLAVETQRELLEGLTDLLTLLIEDPDDMLERKEEIERLQEMVERLDQLIDQEEKHLQDSKEASTATDQFSPDAQSAQAIEQLLGELQTLHRDTQDKYNNQASALPQAELLNRQQELTKQAERLAKLLKDKDEDQAAKKAKAAQQNMADAEEELAEQAYGAAGDAQEDAIEDLKRALDKLTKRPEKEKDTPDFEQLAQAQAKTGEETGQLLEQMKAGEQGQPQSASGQDHVQVSKQHMDAAKQNLDQQDPATAQGEQQQATDHLQAAKAQLEQEIDDLKRQLQQKKLADLKSKFQDMLTQQQSVNRHTVKLNRIPLDSWQRMEQLQAVAQSNAQRKLGQSADECLVILREDGTTMVFPQLIKHLAEEMYWVAGQISDFKVGLPTQEAQADIVATLDGILLAVEDEQQRDQRSQQNQNQQQAGQPGEPSLLPVSAELKLLSNLQERVYRRTRTYHRAGATDLEQAGRIAAKQRDVAQMTHQLSNKLKPPEAKPQSPAENYD